MVKRSRRKQEREDKDSPLVSDMEMKYVKMTKQHPASKAKPSFLASTRLKFRIIVFSYLISLSFCVCLRLAEPGESFSWRTEFVWITGRRWCYNWPEKRRFPVERSCGCSSWLIERHLPLLQLLPTLFSSFQEMASMLGPPFNNILCF